MNGRRIRIWVQSGAVLGVLLAVLSIYDMRHYEGDWTFPSAFDTTLIFVPNLLIMLSALSGLRLPSMPQPFFYTLIAAINACSIALVFLILGTLTEITLSYIAEHRGSK